MTSAITGAIGEYWANANLYGKVDLESYSAELVNIFDRTILIDAGSSDSIAKK